MKGKILKYILRTFFGVRFLPIIKHHDIINTWENGVIVKKEIFDYKAHVVALTHTSGKEEEITLILN